MSVFSAVSKIKFVFEINASRDELAVNTLGHVQSLLNVVHVGYTDNCSFVHEISIGSVTMCMTIAVCITAKTLLLSFKMR